MDQQNNKIVESIFRSLNQAIWIVTTEYEGRRSGLTATWIHQASIDRENPTVLIGLAPNHFTCELLKKSGVCMIHLLNLDQFELAYQFARPSSRNRDKFQDIDCKNHPVQSGQLDVNAPLLSNCHSAMACRVQTSFDAGDRTYFLSELIDAVNNSSEPFLREGNFFGSLSEHQVDELRKDLNEDVTLQRPLLHEWLGSLKNSDS